MKTEYLFKTRCPRCGQTGETSHFEVSPIINCGDCLMNDVEIVQMEVLAQCKRCHQDVQFYKGHWWNEKDDFVCPDGEEAHEPQEPNPNQRNRS